MLTGKPPFKGRGQEELFHKIVNSKIEWPADISLEAKDLISKLLNTVAVKRLTIDEIEKHPWFESIE